MIVDVAGGRRYLMTDFNQLLIVDVGAKVTLTGGNVVGENSVVVKESMMYAC